MQRSDDELVELIKEGSTDAFDQLYQKYASSLLRHLLLLMSNHQEAEDMLHETMMLMIQKINFYHPRADLQNSFKSWLFRLSTNRAIDEIRKRKKHPKEEVTTAPEADVLYETKEKEVLISSLLQKLPLIQRMILSLRVHDDLSYMEISLICGKDINTVKQGLFQARKNMKNLMITQGEIL